MHKYFSGKKIKFFLAIIFFLILVITSFVLLFNNYNTRNLVDKIDKRIFYGQLNILNFADNFLEEIDLIKIIKKL